LHSAGQLAGELAVEPGKPHEAEEIGRAPPVVGRAQPRQLRRQHHVVDDRPPLEQHRGLEDHADVGDRTRDGAAADDDPSRRGGPESGDDPQERRLAAAGRADEREELPLVDGERDPAQRLDRATGGLVDHADPVEGDGLRSRRHYRIDTSPGDSRLSSAAWGAHHTATGAAGYRRGGAGRRGRVC
jgi:hypothetical protein